MSSATLSASIDTIKNSGHAKQLPVRLPPLITLKEDTVHHKLVCGLACECRDVRVGKHFVLRGTCATDSHRNGESCAGAGIRSGPTPIVLGTIGSLDHRPCQFTSACSQTSTPSNSCAMTSMMLSTAFGIPLARSLLLSPSRTCDCRHVSGPDASQPTFTAPPHRCSTWIWGILLHTNPDAAQAHREDAWFNR